MERNLILAVALSICVYVGWFALIDRYYPKPPAAGTAAGRREPPASRDLELSGTPASSAPAAPFAGGEQPRSGDRGPVAAEETWEFRSGGLVLDIRAEGAALSGFRYPGPLGKVELVPHSDPGFLSTWPQLRFEADPETVKAASAPPGKVHPGPFAFRAAHPGGALLRKEYRFDDKTNLHSMRLTFTNPGRKPVELPAWELALGPGLGTVESELKENAKLWKSAALRPPPEGRTQDQIETFKVKEEPSAHEKPWKWLAVENRYFLAAAFPPEDRFSTFVTGASRIGRDAVLAPWLKAQALPVRLEPGGSLTMDIPFYLGPKSYTAMQGLGLGLERSVDFGWFTRLGRLALKVLHRLHRLTGNYGWAIILMTIGLQVVLFPLTWKQMKSAAAMKRVQPEIARIQQKFGKDPSRMNVEMMELYKKHGANPLGGCLPVLVQMPVFVALFNALRNSWELHGAPWMFWVKDLSAHDPFYVLPVLMGGVMFIQSRMNPVQSADPVQGKMFQYMPVIFTFMFLNFPAGLVLYWLTNSALGLLTQTLLKDKL